MVDMRGIDFTGAIKYNMDRSKKLWRQDDLPWPLSLKIMGKFIIGIDTINFATAVAMFQNAQGLLPDGKLGPATYAIMRSLPTIAEESAAAHDFESKSINEDGETEDYGRLALAPPSNIIHSARENVSNRLIIDGESVQLPESMLNVGITASNYIDDGEHYFSQHRSRKKVTNFVIHESVTMSAAQTNRVLDSKRVRSAKDGKGGGKGWDYGIHLNLAPDGHISCHADLVRHRLVHADQLNDSSFGIEVVNPYNPKFGRGPFTETIPGPWWCWTPSNAKKVYCLPTPAQMAAIFHLCRFLCETIPDLPFEFPTAHLNSRKRRIDGWDNRANPGPGIVAHRDFASHADGRYLLEHVIYLSKIPHNEP